MRAIDSSHRKPPEESFSQRSDAIFKSWEITDQPKVVRKSSVTTFYIELTQQKICPLYPKLNPRGFLSTVNRFSQELSDEKFSVTMNGGSLWP